MIGCHKTRSPYSFDEMHWRLHGFLKTWWASINVIIKPVRDFHEQYQLKGWNQWFESCQCSQRLLRLAEKCKACSEQVVVCWCRIVENVGRSRGRKEGRRSRCWWRGGTGGGPVKFLHPGGWCGPRCRCPRYASQMRAGRKMLDTSSILVCFWRPKLFQDAEI